MGNKPRPGARTGSATSIEIDFRYRGVRYRERLKLLPTPANIKHAANVKAAIEADITNGVFDFKKYFPESKRARVAAPGDNVTVGDYVAGWLDEEKRNIQPSTLYGYEKILKHSIKPGFGALKLSELRADHVRVWVKARPEMSSKRIRNILSMLRVSLNDAVEDKLLLANPLNNFRLPRRKVASVGKYAPDPFSSEERAAILAALEGQNRNLVQFAFWTGLRTSELLGLDWSDIDERRGVAIITKRLTVGMDSPQDGTKTKAGRREVKLLGPALEAIKAQKAHTYLKGVEVFQSPLTGERWKGDRRLREGAWTSALKRAKIRYRNPYQTRHTYASMMLTAGESVMWVAGQMGHTDWSLTAKRYGRWIPSDMPNAGLMAVQAWAKKV